MTDYGNVEHARQAAPEYELGGQREKAWERFRQDVAECTAFLKERLKTPLDVLIQLGTGLGELADSFQDAIVLPYAELPHFPRATVESHSGNLVVGQIAGKNVAVLQGRFHYYEGYSAQRVGFPIRVLSQLGAKTAIITNASGGLNPAFHPGDLMLAQDHINLLPDNPLRGPNADEWGPRFPDCSEIYDETLIQEFLESSAALGFWLRNGVYICVPGPSLETPAETRFFRMTGADAIGMSSIPEVLTARHAGLKVAMISVITNVNNPDKFVPIHLEDIVSAARAAEPRLRQLILHFLQNSERI